MSKIIVAGGRDYSNYNELEEILNTVVPHLRGDTVEIVSGNANGADRLGEKFAKKHVLPLKIFVADWEKNGRAAGPIRNREMAAYGTHLLAFWDGSSRGTKNMIDEALRKGLWVKVVRYET